MTNPPDEMVFRTDLYVDWVLKESGMVLDPPEWIKNFDGKSMEWCLQQGQGLLWKDNFFEIKEEYICEYDEDS